MSAQVLNVPTVARFIAELPAKIASLVAEVEAAKVIQPSPSITIDDLYYQQTVVHISGHVHCAGTLLHHIMQCISHDRSSDSTQLPPLCM